MDMCLSVRTHAYYQGCIALRIRTETEARAMKQLWRIVAACMCMPQRIHAHVAVHADRHACSYRFTCTRQRACAGGTRHAVAWGVE